VTLPELPLSLKPTLSGSSIDSGLAEHRGFRLVRRRPSRSTAKAVDHGGVRIGTDKRIG